MNPVDFRLNAIVDAGLSDVGDLAALAATAAQGGATLIQYRDKTGSTRQMIERASAIRTALGGSGVPFVVNDRVDVALAARADGVHLGADDMAPETARLLLGPQAIIGVTVKNAADIARAIDLAADYACIGGVFETLSKINPDPPVGLDGFRTLRAEIEALRPGLPVGAIAGIGLSRVPDVIAAGADGIAVISAIFRAEDIGIATAALRTAIDLALKERRP